MIQLSSKERAFLRKLAHNLDPIVRIGKDGIDENVLNSKIHQLNLTGKWEMKSLTVQNQYLLIK